MSDRPVEPLPPLLPQESAHGISEFLRHRPPVTAPFKDFLCDYQHGGKEWGITIPATSYANASARLRAIGTTGQVRGILHATIPAGPGVGLFVRLYTWLRNIARPASGER